MGNWQKILYIANSLFKERYFVYAKAPSQSPQAAESAERYATIKKLN